MVFHSDLLKRLSVTSPQGTASLGTAGAVRCLHSVMLPECAVRNSAEWSNPHPSSSQLPGITALQGCRWRSARLQTSALISGLLVFD